MTIWAIWQTYAHFKHLSNTCHMTGIWQGDGHIPVIWQVYDKYLVISLSYDRYMPQCHIPSINLVYDSHIIDSYSYAEKLLCQPCRQCSPKKKIIALFQTTNSRWKACNKLCVNGRDWTHNLGIPRPALCQLRYEYMGCQATDICAAFCVWRLPSGGQQVSYQLRETASTRIGSVSPHTVAHSGDKVKWNQNVESIYVLVDSK